VIVSNPAVSTHEPDDLYAFFAGLCAEVDIAVSLFNTPICGYTLSPELVARIADIENIFCIKNPLPTAHTDEVRRLAGKKIVICDPNEGRWLDNIINHKDKLFMSSPDPYLLQTAGGKPCASIRTRRLPAMSPARARCRRPWIRCGVLPTSG